MSFLATWRGGQIFYYMVEAVGGIGTRGHAGLSMLSDAGSLETPVSYPSGLTALPW